MERIRISPYARRTARELGVDVSGLSGSGPNGRILWRDVDAAAAQRRVSAGRTAGLYTSADVAELLRGLSTLNGALTLSDFVRRAAAKMGPAGVTARDLGEGVEGGVPCLQAGERAVLAFGAPWEGRLRLYLAYDPAALTDETAAEFLRAMRVVLEAPMTLLL